MKLSVLMSVRNGESFVRKALVSVLEQSYSEFEFIIIDNGSTDSTTEILGSIKDKRVSVYSIDLAKNYTLGQALNFGLNKCNGDFICRIDADDVWLPNKLQRALLFINKGSDVIGTGCVVILNSHNKSYRYDALPFGMRLVLGLGFPPHSSLVFRRDLAMACGGYDTVWLRAEDLALWLKLLITGAKFSIDNKELVLIEKRYESLSQGEAFVSHINDVAEVRWSYLINPRLISKTRYCSMALKAQNSTTIWRVLYLFINIFCLKTIKFDKNLK